MTARAVTDDRIAVRLLADDWVEVAGLLGEEVARAEARIAGMVPSADDEEFDAALDGVHALRAIRAAIIWSLRRDEARREADDDDAAAGDPRSDHLVAAAGRGTA